MPVYRSQKRNLIELRNNIFWPPSGVIKCNHLVFFYKKMHAACSEEQELYIFLIPQVLFKSRMFFAEY